MFSLARYYIKASLVFLLVGLSVGTLLLVGDRLGSTWYRPEWTTVHVHLLLVGFLLMMVMGMAAWVFPRPVRGTTRYHPHLGSVVFTLLVVSVPLRAAIEFAYPLTRWGWLTPLHVIAGLLQLAATLLFLLYIWPRIRSVGSHLREADGERF